MNDENEPFPTRQSLLSRLKDWNDEKSWKAFFDAYWRLIYNTALKAGLSDAEAQDAVQTTLISVMKSMPNFQYDPKKGSFKSWLLCLTKWRISDQLRKRDLATMPHRYSSPSPDETASDENTTLDRIPDTSGPQWEAIWDEEWERNLVEAAIERVKKKVDPQQYQIFDLHVVKKWTVSKVSATLGVNPGRVYLAKHRVNKLIKKEISYLQTKTA